MRIKVLGPHAILLAGRYEISIIDHGDPSPPGHPKAHETQKIPSVKPEPTKGDKIRNSSGLHVTTIEHIDRHTEHGYLVINDEGEKTSILPDPIGVFDNKTCWQESHHTG